MMAQICIETYAKVECPECGCNEEQITLRDVGDTVSTTWMDCCGYQLLDME